MTQTPRKKTDDKSAPVHITEVDPDVQAKASEAIAQRAWKREIYLALFLTVQTIALGYFHTRNTNAVIQGTTEVKVQTEQVAKKLETSNTEQGKKLDTVVKSSKQTHDLSNSLMLEMKRGRAEDARMLADMASDPASPYHKDYAALAAKAEMHEAAYAAHKKTHDEMQAKEKSKEVGANPNG